MPHNDDVIPDSTYAQLQPPGEFKSEIPAYLLNGASDQDKHIMEALSVGAQYNRWLVNALVETHAQVRRTNGRLIRAEEDIKHLKGDEHSVKVGWKIVGWIAGSLVTIITLAAAVYEALHTGG
jgi:hypothetical protein